tara:strand:+ start:3505 stop:3696 length:192 start_codon:yes stop_codon:yes gene_type:complete
VSSPRFPWEEAMTLGLGMLRMSPETFWRMTLPELAAAARALRPHAEAPMGRLALDRLMRTFPD